jgi:hypothetical protein
MAICLCKGCQQPGTVKINLDRRGGRNAYMCDYHAYNMAGYSTRNNYRIGKAKAHGFSTGIELETSYSDEKARIELETQSFIPTSDCTVNCEYKSGIIRGLNGLVKFAKQWDRLIDAGHLEIGNGCGTHTHFGHVEYINSETNDYMRRFYHSLFVPLCNEMQENREATIELFGRDFTYYADTISEYTDAGAHSNFINLQHMNTIEYRLCKYQNAAQYINLVHCLKDFTTAIINNFIKHFNDTDIDSSRYHNRTEYRKHKAQVTAKKLVKIYRKYAGLDNNGGDGESLPTENTAQTENLPNVRAFLEHIETGVIVQRDIYAAPGDTMDDIFNLVADYIREANPHLFVATEWRLKRVINLETECTIYG